MKKRRNVILEGHGIRLARDNSMSMVAQSGQELLRVYSVLMKCTLCIYLQSLQVFLILFENATLELNLQPMLNGKKLSPASSSWKELRSLCLTIAVDLFYFELISNLEIAFVSFALFDARLSSFSLSLSVKPYSYSMVNPYIRNIAQFSSLRNEYYFVQINLNKTHLN